MGEGASRKKTLTRGDVGFPCIGVAVLLAQRLDGSGAGLVTGEDAARTVLASVQKKDT